MSRFTKKDRKEIREQGITEPKGFTLAEAKKIWQSIDALGELLTSPKLIIVGNKKQQKKRSRNHGPI